MGEETSVVSSPDVCIVQGPEKVDAEISFEQESEELRWDPEPGAEVPTVAAS